MHIFPSFLTHFVQTVAVFSGLKLNFVSCVNYLALSWNFTLKKQKSVALNKCQSFLSVDEIDALVVIYSKEY